MDDKRGPKSPTMISTPHVCTLFTYPQRQTGINPSFECVRVQGGQQVKDDNKRERMHAQLERRRHQMHCFFSALS